ncbi:MAG: DsbC family protein [Mizugakiibacter sp.]|uniref:DsbC family protein n=1 Tax=Mizugakiibacter sp. TaxID=1972610 RepID=UPI0031C6FD48|nr:DsbC family protein [Xanthomonadaceae bacterium]
MSKFLLAAALCVAGAVAVAAAAQAPAPTKTPEQTVADAIHAIAPKVQVSAVEQAGLPGFYQVVADGRVIYVSTDGRYLIEGDVYDLKTRANISEARTATMVKAALDGVPASKRVIFAPQDPKYRVVVFTDPDCPFCRKLHSHIQDFMKAGIAVEYLAFPRSGLHTPSYDKAVSVWCAKDPRDALTRAMAGEKIPALTCDNPVAEEYTLGARIDLPGTPTVFGADGHILGGYMTADELLKKLQQADAMPAKAGG